MRGRGHGILHCRFGIRNQTSIIIHGHVVADNRKFAGRRLAENGPFCVRKELFFLHVTHLDFFVLWGAFYNRGA